MDNTQSAALAAMEDVLDKLASQAKDLTDLEEYAADLYANALTAYEAVERIASGMAADLDAGRPIQPLDAYADGWEEVLHAWRGHLQNWAHGVLQEVQQGGGAT